MIFNFDPPEAWSLNATATINPDITAPTQPNSLRMHFGATDPSASHVLSGLVLGQQYQVFCRINFDALESNPFVNVSLQYRSTVFVSMYKDDNVTGWELRDCGLMTYGTAGFPATADGLFTILGHQTFNVGDVYVDAIYIGELPPTEEELADMARKWPAMEAAANLLRTIAGGDFVTNVDRIGTRFSTPSIDPDVKKPWGVFQQVDSPTDYEYEANSGRRRWRAVGDFYFSENAESDIVNTSAAQAVHEFEDDVFDALKADPTLGGTAHLCLLVEAAPTYGQLTDYAVVTVTLEFEQYLDM